MCVDFIKQLVSLVFSKISGQQRRKQKWLARFLTFQHLTFVILDGGTQHPSPYHEYRNAENLLAEEIFVERKNIMHVLFSLNTIFFLRIKNTAAPNQYKPVQFFLQNNSWDGIPLDIWSEVMFHLSIVPHYSCLQIISLH